MIKTKGEIKTYLFLTLSFLLGFFQYHSVASAESTDTRKVTVAVYPFLDSQYGSADFRISSGIEKELQKSATVLTVPVRLKVREVYEFEPGLLWTGREGSTDRGGILWQIHKKEIINIDSHTSAEYHIYGEVTGSDGKKRIDLYIIKTGNEQPEKAITAYMSKNEEIDGKIKEVSDEITRWIMIDTALRYAEEDIRLYKGGLYTYPAVLDRIREYIKIQPESVPLNALLLDIYLDDNDRMEDEILAAAKKIIELYSPSKAEDTRYLLSLGMDPFDILAGVHEKRNSLEAANMVRKSAMDIFPYRSAVHKNALVRNFLSQAVSFEKQGRIKEAYERFLEAERYLDPSSEYFNEIKDGLKRLG